MGAGRSPISVTDVRARHFNIGDTININNYTNHYYAAAERPPGLHVGVPHMPAHFVGREPLIAMVAQRLIRGSTLALSADGLPGVGKTTLAVALTYHREVLDHFIDGVLWGALGLQPNVMAVLASWAAALGIDVSQEIDPRARAARVRDTIGQRKFLLVIDDAWEPRESALLLRCGGPGCAHFLTTRDESIARAFAGVDGTVEISELKLDDALRLLATLAPEACTADPEAAQRLVEAVGCLPLAIELMGAYLSAAENRYFREQQEAALHRMADPAERLRQACMRLGDTRATTKVTLREIIRLSLHHLPDEAVAAFHALGAFAPKPETFDLAAALAVTGASVGALSRLIERNLLGKQGEALSLHQTVADVAREETPEETVHAHASHYLQRVHTADTDWQDIESIYGQVRWGFSQTSGGTGWVLEFTRALRNYQLVRGLREDSFRWNELELEAARTAGDMKRVGTTLGNRGNLHGLVGEYDRAMELHQQALEILRVVDDDRGLAVTLGNIASVYGNLGEHDRALEIYQQLLPRLRNAGDRLAEGSILHNIGSLYQNQGEPDRALEYLQQALTLRHALGDRAGKAATLNNIGGVYQAQGEFDRALDYFQQALPILRAVGDLRLEATTLTNIGSIHNLRSDLDCALYFCQQALPIARAVGDRPGEAVILNNIAQAYFSLGSRDDALEFYLQALPVMRAVGNRQAEAVALIYLGQIYFSLSDHERALQFFQEAVPVARATGEKQGEAMARTAIAGIHYAEGRLEQGVAELRKLVEWETAEQAPELEADRQLLAQMEAKLAERNNKLNSQ